MAIIFDMVPTRVNLILTKRINELFDCQALFFKSATFCPAGYKGSLLFGGFFNQKTGTTNRTFAVERFVPGSEGAFGEAVAAIKNFTPLGGAFDNLSAAVFLGAGQADLFAVTFSIQGLGTFALRISAAGQKTAIASSFNYHRFAALIANFIRGFFL